MAEFNGSFPTHPVEDSDLKHKVKHKKGKNSRKSLKKKLAKATSQQKCQKKIYKEKVRRLEAEIKLEYAEFLLRQQGNLPDSFSFLHKKKS